jgi:hypothetical protein
MAVVSAELKAIGTAIQAYRTRHDGRWPTSLSALIVERLLPAGALISAADPSGGREGGVPDRYDTWQQSAETDEANSSFLYELSGAAATWDWKSYLAASRRWPRSTRTKTAKSPGRRPSLAVRARRHYADQRAGRLRQQPIPGRALLLARLPRLQGRPHAAFGHQPRRRPRHRLALATVVGERSAAGHAAVACQHAEENLM